MQACFHPAAGIEVFDTLQVNAKDRDASSWLQHWSTHPSMKDRAARMRQRVVDVLRSSPCQYEKELLEAVQHLAVGA
jgi:predicted Zn-dependent protease